MSVYSKLVFNIWASCTSKYVFASPGLSRSILSLCMCSLDAMPCVQRLKTAPLYSLLLPLVYFRCYALCSASSVAIVVFFPVETSMSVVNAWHYQSNLPGLYSVVSLSLKSSMDDVLWFCYDHHHHTLWHVILVLVHIYIYFSVEVDIAFVEAFVIVNRIRVTHARLLHLSCQQRVFDFQEHLCIIKITRITYARRRPLYSQQRVTKRTRNDR